MFHKSQTAPDQLTPQICSRLQNCHSWRTDDIDFNLPRARSDIVLQLQGIDAFVWADARCDDQLGECGPGCHGDPFVSSGQLLLSKDPLGDGGWVSSDGDPDSERLRDDHLETIFETTEVEGWGDYGGERGMLVTEALNSVLNPYSIEMLDGGTL